MGITIIQKSDISKRKPNAKTALVLAGGAVSGGAFKLGGLKALNDFFVNRKITDFDMHVGLSAGALLSAAIANGVPPEEMLKSLSGNSSYFSQLKPWDFYWPNVAEFVSRPVRVGTELLTFSPLATLVLAAAKKESRQRLRELGSQFLQQPSYVNGEEFVSALLGLISEHVEIPNPIQALLPSGFFDNHRLEKYIRENVERIGGYNSFGPLHSNKSKDLYIAATNLNTAERAVFGWDEISNVRISEAVQASTAIPGFYKPVKLNNEYYIDGGVRKTANIDLAIEKGAELIIVYNPFRPLVRNDDENAANPNKRHRNLAHEGLGSIINQVFRTLLHTRLHLGMQRYANDPNFEGDIILIEPRSGDEEFFDTNPMAFWTRAQSAQLGFKSVIRAIEANFDQLRPVLRSYGIEMSHHFVNSELQKLNRSNVLSQSQIFDILEETNAAQPIQLASGV